MKPVRHALLTTFGLGYMKPASGTWGSMPTVVLAGLLIALGIGPWQSPILYNLILLLVLLVFTFACTAHGDEAEAYFHKSDPGQVVGDETAGQAIALFFLPVAASDSWLRVGFLLVTAFLAFRIFDIIKPPPANALQKHPAGWGIVLDDLMAGVYALIVVQGIGWLT